MSPPTLTIAATPIALFCAMDYCRRNKIKWSAHHRAGGKAGRSQFIFTFYTNRMDPAPRVKQLHDSVMAIPREKRMPFIAEYFGGKC